MEAVASTVTPLSVLSRRIEPTKSFSCLTSLSQFKNQSFPSLRISKTALSLSGAALQGTSLLLSSFTSSSLAKALSYEEALQQTVSGGGGGGIDFDIGGILDSFTTFVAENPIIVGGGAAILAVPLVVSQLISKPNKAWGAVNAKTAYANLGDDAGAQLLDIRDPAEIRQVGSPDIRGLKKRPVAIGFKREDKPGFLNRLSLKFKEPESTTLFVLDKFDGNSELVAELATANGFKAAYAIRDGAEGSRGWLNSGLPWILPKKALSFDPSRLLDGISDTFGVASDAVPLILGAAVAAVAGLLTYTEVESILQLLGSIAVLQFVSQKLLPAEERKRTSQQIEEFLTAEIAPKDIPSDIQQIGKAFLPFPVAGKVLPAAAEAAPDVQTKLEAAPGPEPEPEPVVNSVPQARVQEDSLPILSRPLSPYPSYPDYKPPSSPIPSQP